MAERNYEQEWYASNRALHAAWKERDEALAALEAISRCKNPGCRNCKTLATKTVNTIRKSRLAGDSTKDGGA